MTSIMIEKEQLKPIKFPEKKIRNPNFSNLWRLTAFPMLLFIVLPLIALFSLVSLQPKYWNM